MKRILLLLVATLITGISFGQKFQKLEFNVGASLFSPIAKNLSWDDKAWGQRMQLVKPKNDKFAYVLNFGIQQNKDQFVQIPVLLNARHFVYRKIYVTYGTGVTFFNDEKSRFTLTTGWGVQTKRFVIEQSLFRTTASESYLGKPHDNNVGISVLYRL